MRKSSPICHECRLFRSIDGMDGGFRGACDHVLREPHSFFDRTIMIKECDDIEPGDPVSIRYGSLPVEYRDELQALKKEHGPHSYGFRERVRQIVNEAVAVD